MHFGYIDFMKIGEDKIIWNQERVRKLTRKKKEAGIARSVRLRKPTLLASPPCYVYKKACTGPRLDIFF